uniref:Uncharacterized protein n=1 Tax=Caenorhabditis japonica TaxID=281687 RepID=A0A8R1EQ67_CAEJA
MSLPYIFLCFPRDKRLTVYQQIEANEHARYMYKFMEQRREQFKMQQQAAQMQEFHGQQQPNRSHRKRRRNKNHQQKNVNYQPSRQVPVKVKLTFVQPQPKSFHYQPRLAQHQPIIQASVKAAKPIISQCQPKHQQKNFNCQPNRQVAIQAKPQPRSLNDQPSRHVPVKVKLTFVQPQPKSFHYQPRLAQHQPIIQASVKAAKPIISQCQPKHQLTKYNNYQPARQAPVQAKPQSRIVYYQPSRPVKAAKPIISQCQPKHQQPSRKAPVKKLSTNAKMSSNRKAADSGVGSSLNSGNRSPVKLVPNPFYTCPPPVSGTTISPTGVKLVPNPFYTGPPITCKPIVSPTGVKLVPNPFYQCPV